MARNASEVADRLVERMLHDAHLRYQRQQLSGDKVEIPCPEVRGCRRVKTKSELQARNQQFRPEWFTHLRPNFWKAYFETLVICASDRK